MAPPPRGRINWRLLLALGLNAAGWAVLALFARWLVSTYFSRP
jgi:hypothetical protein